MGIGDAHKKNYNCVWKQWNKNKIKKNQQIQQIKIISFCLYFYVNFTSIFDSFFFTWYAVELSILTVRVCKYVYFGQTQKHESWFVIFIFFENCTIHFEKMCNKIEKYTALSSLPSSIKFSAINRWNLEGHRDVQVWIRSRRKIRIILN